MTTEELERWVADFETFHARFASRGTPGWQLTYNHRTASERTFARQKYALKPGQTRTRGGSRWLLRMLLVAMAQYALAWQAHPPFT